MARRFLAPYPTFGTKNNRLGEGHQKKSPYYWWWEFLRRNQEYLECCQRGGKGRHSELYKDFGDVRSNSFREWWVRDQRGATLFAESYGARKLIELNSKEEWLDDWNKDEVMVIAVPLTSSKRYLQSRFAKILKERHTAKRGRPLKKLSTSNAKYQLARNYTIQNLEKTLDVYDEYMKHKGQNPKVPYWKIGENITLIPKAITSPRLKPKENADRRNSMGSSVKRYLKSAEKIIANVALGKFPA